MSKLQPALLQELFDAYQSMDDLACIERIGRIAPGYFMSHVDHDNVQNARDLYIERYTRVQENLGFLAILDHYQFASYLKSHQNLITDASNDRLDVDAFMTEIEATNAYFQLQFYWKVAEICSFTLLFILGAVIMGALFPQVIAPTAVSFLVDPAPVIFGLGAVVSGLSGLSIFTLANKMTPTPEEVISYHSCNK